MSLHSAESIAVAELQPNKKLTKRGIIGRVAVGVAALGLTATPFILREDAAPRAEAAKVSAPARGRQIPENTDAASFVPDVRAAIAAAQTEQLYAYLAAVDQAQKEQLAAYFAGVAVAEAAQQASVPQQSQPTYSTSNPGDFLACVRNRESGGDYTIHNEGGSGASGAYQFLPGTWNSIAASSGRGDLVGMDPAQASPPDQDAMAQALYAQQGAAPWGGSCD